MIYEVLTNLHSFSSTLPNNSNYVLIYTVDKSTKYYLFYNDLVNNVPRFKATFDKHI